MSAVPGDALRQPLQHACLRSGKREAPFTPKKFPASELESEVGAKRTRRATCPEGGAGNAQLLVPRRKPSGRESSSIAPLPGAPSRLSFGSTARLS